MLSTSFSIYHLEYYLLIFARVAGVVSVAPIYGTRGVPRRVRVGLGLCIAIIVASVVEYQPLNYTTIIGFTALLIKELVLGLSVGLASTLCMTIINLSGMFIDREIGLTMVTAFDPTTNASTTISADFYNYMVLVIMLQYRKLSMQHLLTVPSLGLFSSRRVFIRDIMIFLPTSHTFI